MKTIAIWLFLFVSIWATSAQATLWTVDVHNFAFVPSSLTITHGDTVRWHNSSGTHNVHHNATPSRFGNSAAGAPWDYTFVFNSVGDSTFHYVCQIHPSLMQGTITVLPLPTITITSPNGGEDIPIGGQQNLTWSSSGVSGEINIDINRNFPAGSWEPIYSFITNLGQIAWIATGPASEHCRIRVSSFATPAINGISAADFVVSVPNLTVLQPNGGDSLILGAIYNLTWSSQHLAGTNVVIELNNNYPSGAWSQISPLIPNSGSFSWTVAGTPATNCRIGIVSNETSVRDESDSNFVLIMINAPQSLTIHPAGNDIVLSWQPVAGADSYNVFRSTTSDLPEFTELVGNTVGTTLTDSGVVSSFAKYFYQVRAVMN